MLPELLGHLTRLAFVQVEQHLVSYLALLDVDAWIFREFYLAINYFHTSSSFNALEILVEYRSASGI